MTNKIYPEGELKHRLEKHEQWLNSRGKTGEKFQSAPGMIIRDVDFRLYTLEYAYLGGAEFVNCVMPRSMARVMARNIIFCHCDLTQTFANDADFKGAQIMNSKIKKEYFARSNMEMVIVSRGGAGRLWNHAYRKRIYDTTKEPPPKKDDNENPVAETKPLWEKASEIISSLSMLKDPDNKNPLTVEEKLFLKAALPNDKLSNAEEYKEEDLENIMARFNHVDSGTNHQSDLGTTQKTLPQETCFKEMFDEVQPWDEWIPTNDLMNEWDKNKGEIVMLDLLRGPPVSFEAPVKINPLSACAEAPVERLPEATEEEKRILAILLADDPEAIDGDLPPPTPQPSL